MSDFKGQYEDLWARLADDANAPAKAVGGSFEAYGRLEFQVLRMFGLHPEATVIDVGCGSGRLAVQLAPWLKGFYIGTDILPGLLDHARRLCGRSDWIFARTDGHIIAAPDDIADFVCFFSVLTHISHEESWRYLQEAKRVLKPGGKLVCSFLEFRIRSHWTIFQESCADPAPNKILNQFLSRDAFGAFAENAGLEIAAFLDGDQPNIPVEGELLFDNGVRASGMGTLGQSVCVMGKPS